MISATRESHRRIRALRDIPLLAGCTRKQLVRVDLLGTQVDLRPGTTLMREGEVGRECVLVQSGIAVATRGDRRIGTIGAGSVAGELALLDGTTRSATVLTHTPVRLVVLTVREFSQLLAVAPCIEARIEDIAAERRVRLDFPATVVTQCRGRAGAAAVRR
jgi:CRP-like cAMP-binding protein